MCPKRFAHGDHKVRTAFWLFAAAACVLHVRADHSIDEFPRLADESDDAPRLQRAVEATPGGVLRIPAGTYALSATLSITNSCSLEMNKSAVLRAVKEMPFVVRVNDRLKWGLSRNDDRRQNLGTFVTGGRIDGAGLASCMAIDAFHHYTLRDTVFQNGRKYGLAVGSETNGGNELVAENLYFNCFMSGLAGNTAVYAGVSDCHYTDCIVVDWTVGFHLAKGGAQRLTRCHVWGGALPPPHPGEMREMLKDSVCFKVEGSGSILRDCYADTGETGFEIGAWDTRLFGCSYFSNKKYGLDNITIIRHKFGRLFVSGALFVKSAPNVKVYDGCGKVAWRDIIYSGFGPDDYCPGALVEDGRGGKQPGPAASAPLDLAN